MKRQQIIFGAFIFFLIGSCGCIVSSIDFYFHDIPSPSYPLGDISAIIDYNMLTNAEEIISLSDNFGESFSHESFHSYDKAEGINSELSYPFPPDDRVKITSTSVYPWSTICKIYVTTAENTVFVGSGAIIDSYHVLTCAHLIYFHEAGGWPNEVIVVPGMNGLYKPFGLAYATNLRTSSEWIHFKDYQHDWAVITLDSTIGIRTGWMGRMTTDPLDPIYTGILHTAGYPYELDEGECMYYTSDTGESADLNNHWYWLDTSNGQSGSPVWADVNGSLYILSVHTYGYADGETANGGTRLNQDKLDQLATWVAEDSPPLGNPGGWDPNLTLIITFSITIGITIVVIGMLIALRRPSLRPLRRFQKVRYEQEVSQSIPKQLRSKLFGYCPSCGIGIFRDTQRFCSKCGHDLK